MEEVTQSAVPAGGAAPVDSDWGTQRPPARRWRHPVRGTLTTLVLSFLAFWLNALAVMTFSISTTSYDSSGHGGPFRSCTPESVECSHGNPLLAVLAVLVIAATFFGIAFAGQAAGRHQSPWFGRLIMGVLALGSTGLMAVVIWVVTVGS